MSLHTFKAGTAQGSVPDEKAMDAINQFARAKLNAEDVYTFRLRACDDQPDRDYERFSEKCLYELAQLYVGKTVILDHDWAANNQLARIYAASVEQDESTRFLALDCYMLRLPETESVIKAINGGIMREVSVGCAVTGATCGICGKDYYKCNHQSGQSYDGKSCIVTLDHATDAFEVSFVAVPAQRKAGVMKAQNRQQMSIGDVNRAKARLLLEKNRF